MTTTFLMAYLLIAGPCADASVQDTIELEVLFSYGVLLETSRGTFPRPDSVAADETGNTVVYASAEVRSGSCIRWDRWEILPGENTDGISRYLPDSGVRFCFTMAEHYRQLMCCINAEGDTLWTCPLEGTNDFDNAISPFPLSGGDIAVVSHPDCWTTETYIARVSPRGELLWHNYLTTNYLMDMSEEEGETCPKVRSLRETDNGDLLVCGTVSRWVTTPSAMFVALLDGESGEPIWKTTCHLLGEAAANDVAVLASGGFIVVGSTAETVHTEEYPNVAQWGEERPFAVLLSENGKPLGSTLCSGSLARSFNGVIQAHPLTGELILLGAPSSDEPFDVMVLGALVRQR